MNEFFIVAILLVIACGLLYTRFSVLEKRLEKMEKKLNQVAYQVEFPEPAVNNELRQLIQNDEENKAVNVAQEALGMSDIEGKRYIAGIKNDMKTMMN